MENIIDKEVMNKKAKGKLKGRTGRIVRMNTNNKALIKWNIHNGNYPYKNTWVNIDNLIIVNTNNG